MHGWMKRVNGFMAIGLGLARMERDGTRRDESSRDNLKDYPSGRWRKKPDGQSTRMLFLFLLPDEIPRKWPNR